MPEVTVLLLCVSADASARTVRGEDARPDTRLRQTGNHGNIHTTATALFYLNSLTKAVD